MGELTGKQIYAKMLPFIAIFFARKHSTETHKFREISRWGLSQLGSSGVFGTNGPKEKHGESGAKRETNRSTRRRREEEKEKLEDQSTSGTSNVGGLEFCKDGLALCAIRRGCVSGVSRYLAKIAKCAIFRRKRGRFHARKKIGSCV